MNLAVFDVDGTLCATNTVDDECFRRVAEKMLRASVQPADWDAFPNVTDSGIVDTLWRQHFGRPPWRTELDAFIDAYERALAKELHVGPQRFAAVTGAARLLAALQASGWHVVIATGGWSRTARLKLAAASLPTELLHASADDAHDRRTIFDLGRRRAERVHGIVHATAVLIGDAIWDARTASQLGWPFIGVTHVTATATKLRANGATTVVSDFSNTTAIVACLESCINTARSRIPANQQRP